MCCTQQAIVQNLKLVNDLMEEADEKERNRTCLISNREPSASRPSFIELLPGMLTSGGLLRRHQSSNHQCSIA
ncbi:hypothetical protein GCK72_024932 [Caenorhabditis remanei]|uniref:Uncharacterized protein n=1 Tax=Caenorhabditis remanei TaxID=31234 RepID=A0A6A5G1D0_CAERE|nr:hypothetical protein GCK72_024932 [Caenorhabditis remanei]KAF1748465.1 hypothetical protein GCK72_024932 [Caenorhabditis remanei]